MRVVSHDDEGPETGHFSSPNLGKGWSPNSTKKQPGGDKYQVSLLKEGPKEPGKISLDPMVCFPISSNLEHAR
jgi:hypothetical protein